VGCNVVMYASPLAALRNALKLMDPHVIPLLLTLASTAVSAVWLTYGLLSDNWFVAGPNVAGVVLAIVQLAIIGYINVSVARNPSLTKHHALPSDGHGHDDHGHDDHHDGHEHEHEGARMVANASVSRGAKSGPSGGGAPATSLDGIARAVSIRTATTRGLAGAGNTYSPLPDDHHA
jgi:ABC-type nickel/cobalt efflux system permease component RcnA